MSAFSIVEQIDERQLKRGPLLPEGQQGAKMRLWGAPLTPSLPLRVREPLVGRDSSPQERPILLREAVLVLERDTTRPKEDERGDHSPQRRAGQQVVDGCGWYPRPRWQLLGERPKGPQQEEEGQQQRHQGGRA